MAIKSMQRVPSATSWRVEILAGAILILLAVQEHGATTAAAQGITFLPQPENQHSSMIDFNLEEIPDNMFANWIKVTLISPTEVSRVRDAAFMFGACYGGGMLDDVREVLSGIDGPAIKWVGGSASQHDQCSFGQLLGPPPPPPPPVDPLTYGVPPEGSWARELRSQLTNGVRLADAIEYARINDMWGTVFGRENGCVPPDIEYGQLVYDNLGNLITIDDPAAGTRYAVLFAGYADELRHYHNIDFVLLQLLDVWAGKPFRIYVVYGDGLSTDLDGPVSGPLPEYWNNPPNVTLFPGTKGNLQHVLEQVIAPVITVADQFFFYNSDHGGSSVKLPGGFVPGGGGGGPPGTQQHQITPLPGQNRGMERDDDNEPKLSIEYQDLIGNAQVFWNGSLLGELVAQQTSVAFVLVESNIQAENTVLIENHNPDGFTVNEIAFSTGAIGDDPPETRRSAADIPVLSSRGLALLAVLLLALAVLLMRRMRSRAAE